MFCCCPKFKSKHQQTNINEKLMDREQSPRKYSFNNQKSSNNNQKIKQSFNLSQKSIPMSKLQKQFTYYQKALSSSDEKANGNVMPYFDTIKNKSKNLTLINSIKSTISKQKSQLFDFENNTEMIYFDTKKVNEFSLRYLISKNQISQTEEKSLINFVLSKNKSINDQTDEDLVLLISSKTEFESKHLNIPNNVYPIFTNMKRLHRQQGNQGNLGQIAEIIEGDSCIRTKAMDRIIIILESETNVENIKKYSYQTTKRYSLEQFLKIWWVLPSFLSLQDISQIIKQSLRKFIINENIENVSKYIFYEIQLVLNYNLQPFFIVKNQKWNGVKFNDQQLQAKDFQTQMCLAIGLLMTEINSNIVNVVKEFLKNTLLEMKFSDYLKYKTLLQNQKQNFFKKIIDFKLLPQQAVKTLQLNRKIIEYKYQTSEHRRIPIKQTSKKKLTYSYKYQESEVNKSQQKPQKKQEWDQNLRIQDLMIKKKSWDLKQEQQSMNFNLIDQQDIENIIFQNIQLKSQKISQEQKLPSSLRKSTSLQDQYDNFNEDTHVRKQS